MSLQRLRTTRFLLLSLFLFAVAAPSVLRAQTLDTAGRWKRLDFGITTPYKYGDGYLSGTPVFRDSVTGFFQREGIPTQKTTDGGLTWSTLPGPVPVPHAMLPDGFGYSLDGDSITTDGDGAWHVNDGLASFHPDPSTRIFRFVAGSKLRHSVLYWGMRKASGLPRLAFTSDGGTTWTLGDTLAWNGADTALGRPAAFGEFPLPDGMSGALWRWVSLPDQRGAILTAIVSVRGTIGGKAEEIHYFGTIDLAGATAQWRRLDFLGFHVRHIDDDSYYAYDYRRDDAGEISVRALLVSDDRGTTWDSIAAPPEAPVDQLAFLDERTVFARNYNLYSTDGGGSWVPLPTFPFRGTFISAGPRHIYIFGTGGLLARSSDLGRTWRRGPVESRITAAAASRNNVMIGRDHRSILVSRDSGETWTDVGGGDEIPDSVTVIGNLVFSGQEGSEDALAIVGVTTEGGGVRAHTMRSADGGAYWQLGQPLPQLDEALWKAYNGDYEPLDIAFVYETGFIWGRHGLIATTDGGATWQPRTYDFEIYRLDMIDELHGVAFGLARQTSDGGLYTTTDGGTTWSGPTGVPDGFASTLGLRAFSASDFRGIFLYGFSGRSTRVLFNSGDGGATWSKQTLEGVDQIVPAESEWIDAKRIYAIGQAATLSYSGDGGVTFDVLRGQDDAFTIGTIKTPHRVANHARSSSYIYIAGDTAIGRWRLGGEPAGIESDGRATFAAIPRLTTNPVTGGTTIVEYEVARPGVVSVTVHDMLGRRVAALRSEPREPGAHRAVLDVSALAAGRYVLRVRCADGEASVPLAVVR